MLYETQGKVQSGRSTILRAEVLFLIPSCLSLLLCTIPYNFLYIQCLINLAQRHTYIFVLPITYLAAVSMFMLLLCVLLHLPITAQSLQIQQLHHFISLISLSKKEYYYFFTFTTPLLSVRKSTERVTKPAKHDLMQRLIFYNLIISTCYAITVHIDMCMAAQGNNISSWGIRE